MQFNAIILSLWVCLLPMISLAQSNEVKHYITDGAHYDFNANTYPPQYILLNHEWEYEYNTLFKFRPCDKVKGASIANSKGELVAYTKSFGVYNQHHQLIENGDGIKGYGNCYLFVQVGPRNSPIYYLFSSGIDVDSNLNMGCKSAVPDYNPYYVFADSCLYYSIIDMSYNKGKGKVISKNNILSYHASEFTTAVKHANGRDTWIANRKRNSNQIVAYRLSTCGFTDTVTSTVNDTIINKYNIFRGQRILFSPNGKFLYYSGVSNAYMRTEQNYGIVRNQFMYSFNNQTGEIKDITELKRPVDPLRPDYEYSTGNDFFSPNSHYLYMFGAKFRYRTDNFELDTNYLKHYDVLKHESENINYLSGDLKCYINLDYSVNWYVAQDFNNEKITFDTLQNLKDFEFMVGGFGVDNFTPYNPSYMASYYDPNFGIQQDTAWQVKYNADSVCIGDTTVFKLETNDTMKKITWLFGDGNSSNNTSPKHYYAIPGNYKVQLLVQYECKTDTFYLNALVQTPPLPSQLLQDSIIETCSQQPFTICVQRKLEKYLWSNGSQHQCITVQAPFNAYVTASNFCGTANDSIQLFKYQLSTPNIITPNGDGLNDVLKIVSPLSQPIYLQINNRWGAQVFESYNYQNNWDAQQLSDGIYFIETHYPNCEPVKSWLQVAR